MPTHVTFTPSQAGGSNAVPLAWTADPLSLCWSDLKLFYANINNLFGILVPSPSHPLDELHPSPMNMYTLGIHIFLVFYQLSFLLSIPLAIICQVPGAWLLVHCAIALGFNRLVCLLLNGPAYLDSQVHIPTEDAHPEERWIFLNGVSVGSHWLQANVDRLAMTFRRPIRGVHNPTDGIVFDLIQCIVERNFSYSTGDVREAYVQIKGALVDDQYKKVVLILHSQGGIQGSLIVDWLLSEVTQSLLKRLEIYTFGNAANHFNNPHSDVASYLGSSSDQPSLSKSIGHIEHYGNSGDFVARWGILAFTKIANRYMGRIFERPGTGHLLNQHYLNAMFPLGPDGKVLERNEFMELAIDIADHGSANGNPATSVLPNSKVQDGKPLTNGVQIPGQDQRLLGNDRNYSLMETLLSELRPDGVKDDSIVRDVNSPVEVIVKRSSKTIRVKDFSRLWQYRDGRSPPSVAGMGGS